MVFRNSNNRRLSLSHRALVLCTKLQEPLVCWKDDDVIQGLSRDLCGWVFSSLCGPESPPVSYRCQFQEKSLSISTVRNTPDERRSLLRGGSLKSGTVQLRMNDYFKRCYDLPRKFKQDFPTSITQQRTPLFLQVA